MHFPRNADLVGDFTYRVTPVFMGADDSLSYGEAQTVAIELRRETYPGVLNVAFTRGFVSSQAFVDFYESAGPISTLLPSNADAGLDFVPTHPKAAKALAWMGFEARQTILDVLDAAIADKKAKACVIAYDLNEPEIVSRLKKLRKRLRIIVDDSDAHGEAGSAETKAAGELVGTAGHANVRRQHVLNLQHNKVVVVDGPKGQTVACGSTNFSWRGFYVQNNNVLVLQGATAVAAYWAAFEAYWQGPPKGFGDTPSAKWADLGLPGIDARVAFPRTPPRTPCSRRSPRTWASTRPRRCSSLAFLYQTPGPVLDAIKAVTARDDVFVYGISDRKVGGFDFVQPDGNVAPVYPSQLRKGVPPPFSAEPTGGGGIRMHHKFVVIDFDKPTARLYLGSYNFSSPADTKNGENLLRIRDRRIAVSFMIEALRVCDHYQFRVSQGAYKKAGKPFVLRKPPRAPGDLPWWKKDYTDARRIRDRELFA